jgi:hypothetical protein
VILFQYSILFASTPHQITTMSCTFSSSVNFKSYNGGPHAWSLNRMGGGGWVVGEWWCGEWQWCSQLTMTVRTDRLPSSRKARKATSRHGISCKTSLSISLLHTPTHSHIHDNSHSQTWPLSLSSLGKRPASAISDYTDDDGSYARASPHPHTHGDIVVSCRRPHYPLPAHCPKRRGRVSMSPTIASRESSLAPTLQKGRVPRLPSPWRRNRGRGRR